MVDRTQSTRQVDRSELAAYLVELAEEFERSEGAVNVPVGNKTVSLAPPPEVDLEVEVVERSSVLRGSRERLEIDVHWKP